MPSARCCLAARGHLAGDALESRIERGAERRGADDDGNADQRGNEALLDGGRTRLVFHKTLENVLHVG